MLFYCSLNCSVLDILEYIRQYFLDNIACINWYKRCKGLLYLLLLFRFLIFIPSIILIRTFVFVNFVLCSLFFFRNFPNILLSVWELWISKNHNIYTSHGHEITKNLHAPFTWKVEWSSFCYKQYWMIEYSSPIQECCLHWGWRKSDDISEEVEQILISLPSQ